MAFKSKVRPEFSIARLLVGLSATAWADKELAYEPPDRPAGAPDDAEIVSEAGRETSGTSFCEHNIKAAIKRDPKTKNTCGAVAKQPKASLAGKWGAAQVVSLDEHENGVVVLSHYFELMAKYDTNWISHRLGHFSVSERPRDGEKSSFAVTKIYVKDVIRGGAPELVVETVETDDSDTDRKHTTEYVDICSVGASGVPSCTEVKVAENQTSPDYSYKYRLAWSFDKKGRLVLKAKGAWPKSLPKRDYETTTLYFFR